MIRHRASGEVQALRAAAIAVLTLCAALSLTMFVERLVTGWQGPYLVVLCVAAAVEGFALYRVRRMSPGLGPLPAWVIENAVLFVLVQLAIDVVSGHAPFRAWIPLLEWRALAQFVPVCFAWLGGVGMARDFADIDAGPAQMGMRTPVRPLTLRVLAVGSATFLLAGLTQRQVADLLHLPNSSSSGPLIQVIVYFAVGVALLAHASYGLRQGQWREETVDVATGLAGSWARYTFGLLAIVAIGAFVLQYTHPLAAGRGVADTALTQTETWLINILRHFKGGTLPIRPSTLPHITPPPNFHLPPKVPHHAKTHGSGGTFLLQAVLFWTLLTAATIYALRIYARRTRGRVWRGSSVPILGAVIRFLVTLRRLLAGYAAALATHLPTAVRTRPHLGDVLLERPAFLSRSGPRSERQRVLWYYGRTLRRLSHHGLTRGRSQTPGEYAASIAPVLKETRSEFTDLTETFEAARYGPHLVTASQAAKARTAWEHIRDAVRRLRR